LRSPTSRIVALVVTAGLATVGLVACGDESEQSLTFKIGSDGFIQGPSSADPGLTEIAFKNASGLESDMQLIWVKGNRSPAEVTRGLGAAMRGKPLPDWFFAAGGAGPTPPGESVTVTQVLKPGAYFALNTEIKGPPEVDDVGRLEVSGDGTDDEVESDATISAFEYGFEGESLTADSSEIAFENKGAQPHHIVYAPLSGNATAEDVEQFLTSEKGKPPFEEKEAKNTAVLEGGESQLVDLDFEPGRYVLLCFITDRQGGPPHAFKGMVGEVEVE
jgi:copper binding plastocyanin/azurin family protein